MLLRVVGICCLVVESCLFKRSVVIARDLVLTGLDLRPDSADGNINILEGLDEVNSFQCLITELTRITEQSQTLLDV